jgi:hypothetical protein
MLSLHAPFAFPVEAPPELSPHQPSIRACEQSIKELDWLTRDLKGNLSLMGPFMALYIFLGVRVNLIRCVHSGIGVEGESITRGLDALKELSQMWGLGGTFGSAPRTVVLLNITPIRTLCRYHLCRTKRTQATSSRFDSQKYTFGYHRFTCTSFQFVEQYCHHFQHANSLYT